MKECSDLKELFFCHKLEFSKLKNPSLKYQRFTPSGCKYIWITKFEFVAKTQPEFLFISSVVKNLLKTEIRKSTSHSFFISAH